MSEPADLHFYIEEFLHFRGTLHLAGWAHCPGQAVVGASYVLAGEEPRPLPPGDYGRESPDVAALYGPEASHCRFAYRAEASEAQALELRLVFELGDGRQAEASQLAQRSLALDPYHLLYRRFYAMLPELGDHGRALEIGSRARSGNVRRQLLPAGWEYVGLDIKAGENVDVVGDAHALTAVLPRENFDAVFALSTFEHLLMPWKAVLEINQVLRPGGLVMLSTHQSFPLHEIPWDFFRFSDQSWHGLFNAGTGFEIVDTAMGESVALLPRLLHAGVAGMDLGQAFAGSAVIARKVAETSLTWDVDASEIVRSIYPH